MGHVDRATPPYFTAPLRLVDRLAFEYPDGLRMLPGHAFPKPSCY